MYDNNTLEKAPDSNLETKSERFIPPEQDFAKSFEKDVPPFAGEQFGVAHQGNEFYGEAADADEETDDYNEGLSNAAALINYGLDAIAREKGVEVVVQGIKTFDASNSDNPLRDLYFHLGVNTPEELDDARDESRATKAARERFRDEYNAIKATQKGEITMCEIYDKILMEGEAKGEAKGRAKGRAEGRLSVLTDLVRNGIITITQAAEQEKMPVEEFSKLTGLPVQ